MTTLVWTREKPTEAGYYWLKFEPHYGRGIIAWVFVAVDGTLFVDAPIVRYLREVEGWWAGPIPEPSPPPWPGP